jgi:O-methyltransferase domain/Dimerisation domain
MRALSPTVSQIAIESDDPSRALLELMSGAWATQAIHAAARLGIADQLAAGSVSGGELAARTGTDEESLGRVLRYLVALGVLIEKEERFALTEKGRLLRTDLPGSLHYAALLYGGMFYQSFAALHETVRTGVSAFEHVFGMPPFEYMSCHPDQAQIFDRAMAAGRQFFAAVPAAVDLAGVEVVVDVGGGVGDLLARILLAQPRVRGVLVELPHVLGRARAHLRACGCLDRCDLVAGDLTERVPDGGDMYLLSRILHDWPDPICETILRNCRASMHDDAALMIIERPLPTDRSLSLAGAWDINMMVNNVGGRERTIDEYERLLRRGGFLLRQRRPLGLEMEALLARPTNRLDQFA